jgi:hypothetical protein
VVQTVDVDRDPSSGTTAGVGEEDWLADVGDVDWVDTEPGGERLPYRPSTETGPRFPSDGSDGEHALIQRRRLIAGLVALVVGLAIAIPVLVFGGGGGGSPVVTEPPATTTPTTPPATTPTHTTTTNTSTTKPTGTTSTSFKLPAGTKLQTGSTGAAVTDLQNALTTLGYDPGKVDGDFGPTTQAAVVKFQTDKGLSPDGVVGPKTEAALNEALAAKAKTG